MRRGVGIRVKMSSRRIKILERKAEKKKIVLATHASLELLRSKALTGGTIKARDLTKLFGITDRFYLTVLGRLLSEMAKLGMTRLVSSSPRRYVLTESGRRWVMYCDGSMKCEGESLCGYYGICPLRNLLHNWWGDKA